jgi:hypothetical protein
MLKYKKIKLIFKKFIDILINFFIFFEIYFYKYFKFVLSYVYNAKMILNVINALIKIWIINKINVYVLSKLYMTNLL